MSNTGGAVHRLEELIQANDVVAKRVAEACGVDYSTLYRWRRGAPLPSQHLPTLTTFFDVSVEYLLGWDRNGERAA